MERTNQCGVYRLFKLSKGVGNTFSTEFKKIERDLHVVNHDYADLINKNCHVNGLFYEYDEKASNLYWSKKPFKTVKEFAEFKEVNEETETNIEDLKLEYETLSGKKAHHLWKEDTLAEKINELKK